MCLENIMYQIQKNGGENIESIDDLREITEVGGGFDETLMSDLSLEEKLSAIEKHSDEIDSIDW